MSYLNPPPLKRERLSNGRVIVEPTALEFDDMQLAYRELDQAKKPEPDTKWSEIDPQWQRFYVRHGRTLAGYNRFCVDGA